MRFIIFISRAMLYSAVGVVAFALCAPVHAGSWSSTMAVRATVVSSCTLSITPDTTRPGIQSHCTRGERPSVALTEFPTPPALIQRETGHDGAEFLVVTY